MFTFNHFFTISNLSFYFYPLTDFLFKETLILKLSEGKLSLLFLLNIQILTTKSIIKLRITIFTKKFK